MGTPGAPNRRTWAGNIARYGGVNSYGVWKLAIDAYYWDRLEQAHDLALELGVTFGWQEWFFRLIEAEAETRKTSSIQKLEDRVSLEIVPHQVHHSHQVTLDVQQACSDVRTRFGWPEGADTLISVLAEETDAPWTVGRAGYMMDKYPYDKICIPLGVTHQPPLLQSTIRHEYAHVMVLNLTAGKAPIYIHEAITMVAQDWPRPEDWIRFVNGSALWLDPHTLSAAFDDQHNPARAHARSLAYSQSAAIGYFLKSLDGEKTLANLLRALDGHSNWHELVMNLRGQSPLDDALRHTYKFGEKELFQKTLEWLRTLRIRYQ